MNLDAPVVAMMLFQLGLDLGRVTHEVELADVGILFESHRGSAHDIRRAEIAAHRIESDFHGTAILRRTGRESKTKNNLKGALMPRPPHDCVRVGAPRPSTLGADAQHLAALVITARRARSVRL